MVRKNVCGHGRCTGQRSYGRPALCAGLSGHFTIGYMMWTAWNCSLLIQSPGYRKFTDPAGDLCCYVLCGLKLALMSLASIPISLLSMVIMYSVGMKRMGPYYQSAQKMNNTIIEYINGMEVVKVFNRESESYENFRKDVTDYRDYTLAWYKAAQES